MWLAKEHDETTALNKRSMSWPCLITFCDVPFASL